MKKFRPIFVLLVMLCITFFPTSTGVAFADTGTVQGSNVIDDLSKDNAFSQYNYPINEADNTISIVTIAESWNNELLIYTYQPNANKNYRANYISMSTAINDSIDPKIYELTYCNNDGTLAKYVVRNFVVNSNDKVRYYEIYSIFRPFDKTVDDPAKNDNTINSIPFNVAKQWFFSSINGNAYVECNDIETIYITEKYVGFCRYMNGYPTLFFDEYTDSHFVAFSTNKNIEKLIEAKVYFETETYEMSASMTAPKYGKPVPHEFVCRAEQVVETTSGLFIKHSHEYNRIQTVESFISSEQDLYTYYESSFVNIRGGTELSENAKSALQNMQWVLRFYESSFDKGSMGLSGTWWENGERVRNVTVLRLKFESNGIVYNLGVVDNMQTGTSVPSNVNGTEITLSDDAKEFLTVFLKVLLIVVGVIILAVIFIYIAPPLWKVIKFVAKIIVAPFKWLFGSRSSGRSNKGR